MPVALALKWLKESRYRTVIVALFFCFGQAAGQYYVSKLLFFPGYSSFPNIIQVHLGPLVYNGLYAYSIGELNTCMYTQGPSQEFNDTCPKQHYQHFCPFRFSYLASLNPYTNYI